MVSQPPAPGVNADTDDEGSLRQIQSRVCRKAHKGRLLSAASLTDRKFFDCDRRKALPPPALTKL
jgi:hypothetical protein